MNLTKLCVAGLCLTALTASAVVKKANAFETLADQQQAGWWVGVDKSLQSEGVVVSGDASLDGYTGVRPMTDVTSNQVLKLDTAGVFWTNTVNESFETTPIFADMLVKFVPSEQLEPPTEGKLAIAIKLGLDGTNYLNIANHTPDSFLWAETAQMISTSEWYRVTVKMYWDVNAESTYAQTYVNGTAVGSPLILDGNTTLNSIGFQGTGFIDEVVVRDDDPITIGTTLILSFAAGIESVFVGETQKTSGQTVLSGDTLVIKAAQWKEIADVTGPSTVTWVAGAAGASAATVTVANATSTTVTIADQTETSTTGTSGTGTSFDGAPMNKVATWALANGVTTLSNGIYDNYLLNIADETSPTPDLLITSISVSGSTVTVTVAATGVNFATINGTLKIKAYPTLGGAETLYTANVTGYSPVTIVQDIGSNKFVKAAVE